MKTMKKSLAVLLAVLTLFGAMAMCASAAEEEYIGISAWDIDSRGVYLAYGFVDTFDSVAPGKTVKIYRSDEPYYYDEIDAAIESGEAEFVGVVESSNIELVVREVNGWDFRCVYVKPTFDFDKSAYYHFVLEEGLLVTDDGEYYSSAEIYIDAPIFSTKFRSSGNFFQKIIDFFQKIIDWFRNLFSK